MKQLSSKFGASNDIFNHSQPKQVKHSKFPLSRLVNLTADPGMIIPYDTFKVYPGDRIDMSAVFGLDTLPLVQAPLTRYKVLIHVYYMKARDCWKGAKTQITKGRSGNVQKNTPLVDLQLPLGTVAYAPFTNVATKYDFDVLPESHHSLSAFLGVPPSVSGLYTGLSTEADGAFSMDKAYLPFTFKAVDSDMTLKDDYNSAISTGFNQYRYVNALPFVMYQSVVKNNYVVQNLLQDNTALFPEEGDDDWLLPYNATTTNFVTEADNTNAASFVYDYNGVYTSSDTAVRLDQLRYSIFDDDYFTTGLPWLQRGDVTNTQVDVLSDVYLDASEVVTTGNEGVAYPAVGLNNNNNEFVAGQLDVGNLGVTKYNSLNTVLAKTLSKIKLAENSNMQISLTANKIREVLAMSVWQERNARVDGSYNNMIYQHWQTNPNSEEHLPVYIGGTATTVSFNTILQQSESTSDSPLGATAGMGLGSSSGKICNNFYVPDYGYVMAILQIKPDTTYMQGVEHFLSCENTFEDMVFPEFQNLSPEPIKVKELYVCDNDTDNEDLFAYQEPFTYAKIRQNVNRGLFQQKPDKDRLFAAFTQARWLTQKPQLSYQFLVMSPENMRRDYLAYPSYPAFRLQISDEVYVIRSLAYTSVAETFGF